MRRGRLDQVTTKGHSEGLGRMQKWGPPTIGLNSGVGGGAARAVLLVAVGNAGDLPGTAQSSAGVQPFGTPLDAITGSFAANDDQDMFRIYISDPVNFSATSNNAETVVGDTMLFLFDENGRGVLATDDIDGLNYKSTLSAGSLAASPAGVYHIAVSKAFNVPVSGLPPSNSNEIFLEGELEATSETIGANGAGAADPVLGWFLFPFDDEVGAYRINMTGATFVDAAPGVPAMGPAASVGLSLLLGACGIAALRIRSSRNELDG
jgi:hypothetical protein